VKITAASVLVIAALAAAFAAPAPAAEVTIGANVNQATSESGTCGFMSAAERPCTFITSVIPGQTMTAPCSGTVTRFRLNGFPKPADHYSLRVVRRNADGSFTGTATSAVVAIGVEGVNEYATSLPIAAGEGIGIDFQDSAEEHGLRWIAGSAISAGYFYAFPADGSSAFATGPATFAYLFNADIACASASAGPLPAPPAPVGTVPSNHFTIVKLEGTALTLDLSSAGAVGIAEVAPKKSSKAKGARRLLKPSATSGGPGHVKVGLRLTAAARKLLGKKGKLAVRASITFTPTGGTAANQVRKLTVKKRKAA
jgi:hypothetical protein